MTFETIAIEVPETPESPPPTYRDACASALKDITHSFGRVFRASCLSYMDPKGMDQLMREERAEGCESVPGFCGYATGCTMGIGCRFLMMFTMLVCGIVIPLLLTSPCWGTAWLIYWLIYYY